MGAAEALGGRGKDRLRGALRIGQHRVVPETQHAPSVGFERSRSFPVIGNRVEMLAAVQLDDQPRVTTGKIGDIRTDHQLPREARPIGCENAPQGTFRFGRAIPKRPGMSGETRRNALHDADPNRTRHARLPTPSPSLPGRGVAPEILRACLCPTANVPVMFSSFDAKTPEEDHARTPPARRRLPSPAEPPPPEAPRKPVWRKFIPSYSLNFLNFRR